MSTQEWREAQRRIYFRHRRLNHLIRAGILQPTDDKVTLRKEIELLCVGHPIQRVARGVSGRNGR